MTFFYHVQNNRNYRLWHDENTALALYNIGRKHSIIVDNRHGRATPRCSIFRDFMTFENDGPFVTWRKNIEIIDSVTVKICRPHNGVARRHVVPCVRLAFNFHRKTISTVFVRAHLTYIMLCRYLFCFFSRFSFFFRQKRQLHEINNVSSW